MDVQSTEGAPPTHGKEAHGLPFCTPPGQKVFCLANHDFHRCPQGQASCCRDGSDPVHREIIHNRHVHEEPASNEDMCTPLTASGAIVLDDQDDQPTMREMANVVPGSDPKCMKDAYLGQFHHDNTQNKGKAHVSYSFDPPKSGCYLLEEYHPGSDEMCARHQPSNAQLDVDYCRGLQQTFHINQGRNGGQWNPVAKLMFYEGRMGKVTMRNAVGEQCRSPPCFFVTDAFRMTWTHDTCSPDAHLSFDVRLSEDSAQSEVLPKIKEHKAVLEATLLTHFGYPAVQVLDVISSTSRRLGDQAPGVASFAAVLLLHGAPATPGAPGLAKALQKAFEDAGASLQIESAALQAATKVLETPASTPVTSPNRNTVEDSSSALVIVLVGSGLAALLMATACGWLVWSSRKKMAASKAAPGKTESAAAHGDLEGATTKDEIQDEKLKEKTDHSDGMDSASTGTPASQADLENFPVTPTSSDAQDAFM